MRTPSHSRRQGRLLSALVLQVPRRCVVWWVGVRAPALDANALSLLSEHKAAASIVHPPRVCDMADDCCSTSCAAVAASQHAIFLLKRRCRLITAAVAARS